jgi:hypothetical protein
MTEKDYRIIKEKAVSANMKISRYMTTASSGTDIVVNNGAKDVAHELRKIGVNLNHLTMRLIKDSKVRGAGEMRGAVNVHGSY